MGNQLPETAHINLRNRTRKGEGVGTSDILLFAKEALPLIAKDGTRTEDTRIHPSELGAPAITWCAKYSNGATKTENQPQANAPTLRERAKGQNLAILRGSPWPS